MLRVPTTAYLQHSNGYGRWKNVFRNAKHEYQAGVTPLDVPLLQPADKSAATSTTATAHWSVGAV